MKIGCCLNMLASENDKAGIEYISAAADAGFDYLEPPLAEFEQMNDSKLLQIKQLLDEKNIKFEAFSNLFPARLHLTGSNVDQYLVKDYIEKALAIAAYFHSEYVVFGSGAARRVPDGFSKEKAYEQLVELLIRIAPIARKNNIVIVVEPLNQKECNIINTFREGCLLAKDANDPYIRGLVDYYHYSLENDSPDDIITYGPEFLYHAHFAETYQRSYPTEMKEAYLPFIQAIKAIGYDSRLTCEGYSKDFSNDAKQSLRLFREIFK